MVVIRHLRPRPTARSDAAGRSRMMPSTILRSFGSAPSAASTIPVAVACPNASGRQTFVTVAKPSTRSPSSLQQSPRARSTCRSRRRRSVDRAGIRRGFRDLAPSRPHKCHDGPRSSRCWRFPKPVAERHDRKAYSYRETAGRMSRRAGPPGAANIRLIWSSMTTISPCR